MSGSNFSHLRSAMLFLHVRISPRNPPNCTWKGRCYAVRLCYAAAVMLCELLIRYRHPQSVKQAVETGRALTAVMKLLVPRAKTTA